MPSKFASRPGGRRIVLKLTPDPEIAADEAIVLRAWAATRQADAGIAIQQNGGLHGCLFLQLVMFDMRRACVQRQRPSRCVPCRRSDR